MNTRELVRTWFELWNSGDFSDLPLAENFVHESPYGVIKSKEAYMNLVSSNKDKFLGHRFEIHDEMYGQGQACIRYTAIQGDFNMEVSEWHYTRDGVIERIVAYYNIEGEISEDRKLSNPEEYDKNF